MYPPCRRGSISDSCSDFLSRYLTKEYNVDVLLWKNKAGEVLETSFGNLFAISDGSICTPPAQGAILNGIGRRTLIRAANNLGVEVFEVPLLVTKGGWWMTSALRGLQRLDISLDAKIIPILRREIEKRSHSMARIRCV